MTQLPEGNADKVGTKFVRDGFGVIHQRSFVAEGEDADLLGRKPEREVAGVMLDEEGFA